MIVDIHTHLWDAPEQLGPMAAQHMRQREAAPWQRPEPSPTAYDEAMLPVDFALIVGVQSQHLRASIPPEQVARYVQRNPGKYLGVAGIDPMAPGYLATLDKAEQLGLIGVMISPAAAGFHPAHTRAMRLYEQCQDKGLPVFVHPATNLAPQVMLEFSQPYLFDEVARAFPDLPLVIAQMGFPWIDQTLTMIGKHRHVYADLTDVVGRPWQLYNVLLSAHQLGVMSHLLLGSNYPFSTPEHVISTIYSVNTFSQGTHLPSVPREQLRSIVERDALTCLTIARPSQAPPSTDASEPDEDDEALHEPAPSAPQAEAARAMPAAPSPRDAAGDSQPDQAPTLKEGIR